MCHGRQPQEAVEEIDYPDSFQLGCRTVYSNEIVFMDDKDKGHITFLILLDFSSSFDSIYHVFLADCLKGLRVGDNVL